MTDTKRNWISPAEFEKFPPARAADTHKGTYGHLTITAGSMGFHGAAVLAARAAQRAQPGLITVLAQEAVYYPVAAQLQAVMVDVWSSEIRRFDKSTGLLFGPGLAAADVAESVRVLFRRLWRDFTGPVVVDASALIWLVPHSLGKDLIRVVTPHPGEAANFLKQPVPHVQANRETTLREISRRLGNCWVVLKGHHTLVGRSEGEIFVNPAGNPHLAQGGSGDILSGFLSGLLAQPALQADPGRTIRYAVWQHGAAADKLQATRKNWVVEDLIQELGSVG